MERCLQGCIRFYGIFMSMEDIGLLDPINEIDVWCLHYCFCHVINTKLKSWANAWIRHPLSSEQNKTPLQLWVQGNFENAEIALQDQSDVMIVMFVMIMVWIGMVRQVLMLIMKRMLKLLKPTVHYLNNSWINLMLSSSRIAQLIPPPWILSETIHL